MARYDGMHAKDLPIVKNLIPIIMTSRAVNTAEYLTQFDLSKTLPYIIRFNENLYKQGFERKDRLKFFHVFLCAIARTLSLHPQMNLFITGRRYYQRNRLQLTFVVKKELKKEATESLTKIDFDPFDTLEIVRKRVYEKINRARRDKGNEQEGEIELFARFPRFILMFLFKFLKFLDFFGIMPKSLIETDPFFCSAVIVNLGSIKLRGTILHHILEWGNAGWFIVNGKIHKGQVIDEDGNSEIKDVVDIGITLDERISEGMYYIEGIVDLQKFVENPELLEIPPEISQENLDILALNDPRNKKEYKKRLKYLKHKQKEQIKKAKEKKK